MSQKGRNCVQEERLRNYNWWIGHQICENCGIKDCKWADCYWDCVIKQGKMIALTWKCEI